MMQDQPKARVLLDRYPEFSLIETLLWTAGYGFSLLDLHFQRLQDSAAYFQFNLSVEHLHESLEKAALGADSRYRQFRITLSRCGKLDVESSPLVSIGGSKVALARRPLVEHSPFLHHKTTHREHYLVLLEEHREHQPGIADLIFWNEAGFITESSIANVVVGIGEELFTPALAQGLLPGVFRKALVQRGVVKEKDIRIDDLYEAESLFLVNSVREWMPLDWDSSESLWVVRSDLNFDTPRAW
jgi:para-aminobenzoate synthetase/4-amino-4-deoxychorismate lyase